MAGKFQSLSAVNFMCIHVLMFPLPKQVKAIEQKGDCFVEFFDGEYCFTKSICDRRWHANSYERVASVESNIGFHIGKRYAIVELAS